MGYQIAFWVVFAIILTIISIVVWLCVQKKKDEHILKLSAIGLQFLLQSYLKKCFQKVCVLLIKSDNQIISKKLTSEDVSDQQEKFSKMYIDIFTPKLITFARGIDIIKNINDNVGLNQYTDLDLFLFPDQIIHDNDYYKNLLFYASEKTLIHPISKSNQESKSYIFQLANDNKM